MFCESMNSGSLNPISNLAHWIYVMYFHGSKHCMAPRNGASSLISYEFQKDEYNQNPPLNPKKGGSEQANFPGHPARVADFTGWERWGPSEKEMVERLIREEGTKVRPLSAQMFHRWFLLSTLLLI